MSEFDPVFTFDTDISIDWQPEKWSIDWLSNRSNKTMANPKGTKQRSKRGALPEWMTEPIKRAELLFKQARNEDILGNHKTAELLRDQAEAIYDELLARQAGQPGAPVQEQGQRIAITPNTNPR